jgi:hypothetical protein
MYLDYMDDNTRFLREYIWKIKVPLKIRIFMWFLQPKVLLTKDNLAKRKWKGCNKCCFRDQMETIQHLYISCPLAKKVWRIFIWSSILFHPQILQIFLEIGQWG